MSVKTDRAWRARERQAEALHPTDSEGHPLRPMGQAQWDRLADRMGAAAERTLDAAQHGTPEAKAAAVAAHEDTKARANQDNPWEHPPLWDEEPMSPEDEEQAGWN